MSERQRIENTLQQRSGDDSSLGVETKLSFFPDEQLEEFYEVFPEQQDQEFWIDSFFLNPKGTIKSYYDLEDKLPDHRDRNQYYQMANSGNPNAARDWADTTAKLDAAIDKRYELVGTNKLKGLGQGSADEGMADIRAFHGKDSDAMRERHRVRAGRELENYQQLEKELGYGHPILDSAKNRLRRLGFTADDVTAGNFDPDKTYAEFSGEKGFREGTGEFAAWGAAQIPAMLAGGFAAAGEFGNNLSKMEPKYLATGLGTLAHLHPFGEYLTDKYDIPDLRDFMDEYTTNPDIDVQAPMDAMTGFSELLTKAMGADLESEEAQMLAQEGAPDVFAPMHAPIYGMQHGLEAMGREPRDAAAAAEFLGFGLPFVSVPAGYMIYPFLEEETKENIKAHMEGLPNGDL